MGLGLGLQLQHLASVCGWSIIKIHKTVSQSVHPPPKAAQDEGFVWSNLAKLFLLLVQLLTATTTLTRFDQDLPAFIISDGNVVVLLPVSKICIYVQTTVIPLIMIITVAYMKEAALACLLRGE
ncbi:unnamed protein product [Linum tenue]|uniref:Uncharacterized protein n=1 Tax=Linum tenue TaxID=586396 RepID=A0AAV0JMT7_9ROSI|nr:unnamed protein product [Linum tenue]